MKSVPVAYAVNSAQYSHERTNAVWDANGLIRISENLENHTKVAFYGNAPKRKV
jgi:hypothetical protein